MPRRLSAADIRAALLVRGVNLYDIDRAFKLPEGTCSFALRRPHREAELAIAETMGKSPRELWPDRYYADGGRKTPQPAEHYIHPNQKNQRQKRKAA